MCTRELFLPRQRFTQPDSIYHPLRRRAKQRHLCRRQAYHPSTELGFTNKLKNYIYSSIFMVFLLIEAIEPSPAPMSKLEGEIDRIVLMPPMKILFKGPTRLKVAFSI